MIVSLDPYSDFSMFFFELQKQYKTTKKYKSGFQYHGRKKNDTIWSTMRLYVYVLALSEERGRDRKLKTCIKKNNSIKWGVVHFILHNHCLCFDWQTDYLYLHWSKRGYAVKWKTINDYCIGTKRVVIHLYIFAFFSFRFIRYAIRFTTI